MTLDLTQDEVALVVELIRVRLDELGSELRRTEQMELHDNLKAQKKSLDELLRKLRQES